MYLQALITTLSLGVGTVTTSSCPKESGVFFGLVDTPDYPALFGGEWRAAERYASEQRGSWSEIWVGIGVAPEVAEAVVFPELIRYSALQNTLETAATRALYQQRGSRGADFSIGRFQMKPSFVERVERRWMASEWSAESGIAFDTADTPEARHARVRRMDEELWQCTYLAMFLRLLYADNPSLADAPTERQVRLCAAAYNGGLVNTGDLAVAERLATRAFYHTDFIPDKNTKYHNYSEIATFYYNNTLKP